MHEVFLFNFPLRDHFRYFLGVCVRLVEVVRSVRLIKVSFKVIREINLVTSATVRLIEGVRLNTGFTVLQF